MGGNANDPYAYKSILPLWRVTDPLSVEDAAALMAGFDPHSVDETRMFFLNRETNLTDSDGITQVHAAQTALENAVIAGHLPATIRRSAWERGWDEEPEKGEAYAKAVKLLPGDIAKRLAMLIFVERWVRAESSTALRLTGD